VKVPGMGLVACVLRNARPSSAFLFSLARLSRVHCLGSGRLALGSPYPAAWKMSGFGRCERWRVAGGASRLVGLTRFLKTWIGVPRMGWIRLATFFAVESILELAGEEGDQEKGQ
jgi:hypothetical protein